MKITTTDFAGLVIIERPIFYDERGCFFEAYNKLRFEALGLNIDFLQDNVSVSGKNVLRGLHFQNPPFAQGKLVSVIQGSVLDIVVDIRKASPTYGKSYKLELNSKNGLMMYVPPGFAHGFVTIEDNTIFSYKCTNVYNKASEGGIMWNDPVLNIDWETQRPILSPKDLELSDFSGFNTLF